MNAVPRRRQYPETSPSPITSLRTANSAQNRDTRNSAEDKQAVTANWYVCTIKHYEENYRYAKKVS